jgi:hypothetical protein
VTTTLLAENALVDAKDLAITLGRKFTDDDVSSGSYGDLMLAAVQFLKITETTDSFVVSVKTQFIRKGEISVKQARALLNVMRQEMSLDNKPVDNTEECPEPPIPPVDPRETRQYRCFKCPQILTGITALKNHKLTHAAAPAPVDGDAVIENRENTLGIDISSLPNGYYALPDMSGKHAFIYLMVRRTRRKMFRDRRFVYGQKIVGGEWVPEGTIEIKEWSQDAKRLCGEMKPDDVYRGEFEEVIPMLLANPKVWAIVFGQQIGRCGRCGKTLTDDDSRAAGIGPECVKKDHDGYWKSFGKKVNLHGGNVEQVA